MQCLRCKSENEEGAKFCATCGAPLYKAAAPLVCHVCSYANTPGANFCVACGAHLRRRFVTPPPAGPAAGAAAAAATMSATPAMGQARAKAEAPPTPRREPPTAASEPAPGPATEQTNQPPPSMQAARAAAASHVRQEAFDEPAIPPPRISGFELKAGLAVLILFLGGGLYWWSSQNDSRLAELALTTAAPAQSALRAVADNTSNPPPTRVPVPAPPPANTYVPTAESATAKPPAPTQSAALAAPAAPTPPAIREDASKTKSSKHKNTRRRRAESEDRVASAAPEAVAEPQVTAQPLEKRRPNLRELVASCRRMQLFEGERCLWRLCDGKWGKDGCPSYN